MTSQYLLLFLQGSIFHVNPFTSLRLFISRSKMQFEDTGNDQTEDQTWEESSPQAEEPEFGGGDDNVSIPPPDTILATEFGAKEDIVRSVDDEEEEENSINPSISPTFVKVISPIDFDNNSAHDIDGAATKSDEKTNQAVPIERSAEKAEDEHKEPIETDQVLLEVTAPPSLATEVPQAIVAENKIISEDEKSDTMTNNLNVSPPGPHTLFGSGNGAAKRRNEIHHQDDGPQKEGVFQETTTDKDMTSTQQQDDLRSSAEAGLPQYPSPLFYQKSDDGAFSSTVFGTHSPKERRRRLLAQQDSLHQQTSPRFFGRGGNSRNRLIQEDDEEVNKAASNKATDNSIPSPHFHHYLNDPEEIATVRDTAKTNNAINQSGPQRSQSPRRDLHTGLLAAVFDTFNTENVDRNTERAPKIKGEHFVNKKEFEFSPAINQPTNQTFVASTSLRAPRTIDLAGYSAMREDLLNQNSQPKMLKTFTSSDYKEWLLAKRENKTNTPPTTHHSSQMGPLLSSDRVLDISGFGSTLQSTASTNPEISLRLDSHDALVARHYYAQLKGFYKWYFLEASSPSASLQASNQNATTENNNNNKLLLQAKVQTIPEILSHYGLLDLRSAVGSASVMGSKNDNKSNSAELTATLFSNVPEYDYASQMQLLGLSTLPPTPNNDSPFPNNKASTLLLSSRRQSVPLTFASPLTFHKRFQHQHAIIGVADPEVLRKADRLFAGLRGKYAAHNFPFIHYGAYGACLENL